MRWLSGVLHAVAGMVLVNPLAVRADTCSVQSADNVVPLIELYTSQGCSSCPPADRWLSKLSAQVSAVQAIPLSLHVGYWDYIGWKDPFAKPEFNDRQRDLATFAGSRNVYTPEVFVSGAELYDWRSGSSFEGRLAQLQAKPAPFRISLTAQSTADAVDVSVDVKPLTSAPARAKLVLALKQHGNRTDVRAGENRGEQLTNDHVVRHWIDALPTSSPQNVELPLPSDGPRRFEIVAFVQDARSGTVLQAVALPLGECAAAK